MYLISGLPLKDRNRLSLGGNLGVSDICSCPPGHSSIPPWTGSILRKKGCSVNGERKMGSTTSTTFIAIFSSYKQGVKTQTPPPKCHNVLLLVFFLFVFLGGEETGNWVNSRCSGLLPGSFSEITPGWTSGTLHSVQDGSAAYMDSVTPALSPAPHQKISLWGLSWCICLGFELCV